MDRGEYVIFGVKGSLGWGKAEKEKFVDFGDESQVVTVELLKGDTAEMAAVKAEVFYEQEATEHTVSFSAVGLGGQIQGRGTGLR